VAGKTVKTGLALHRDERGGFFTLMIQPPSTLKEIPASPREMVFVLDCSGSMEGEPLAAAKKLVERCMKRMGQDDTFQIVGFSDSSSQIGSQPIPATPENVRKGLRYLEGLNSEGGTMMMEGVRAALDFAHDPGRFRTVSFLTDGYIGDDREVIGEVRKRIGASRLFSFGIGSSPNWYLLEGMARVGRGGVARVGLDESSQRAADEFYQRIEHPALTDIQIDWGSMSVKEVYPNPLPDLFVGRPVILTGRFEGSGPATVRVVGDVGGQRHELSMEVNLGAPDLDHEALALAWARSKISTLYDRMTYVPDASECAEEICNVALEFGLISDFTAFVAVDSLTKTAGDHGTTVPVAVPVPKGVQYGTTVGEKPR
jgi:Ca-activated chloride channel family protein